MKSILVPCFKTFTLTTVCLLFLTLHADAQTDLPLADKIGEWSEPQIRYLGNASTPKIQVRSKLIKHFGTTGIFDVEITNLSNQTITNFCGLKVPKGHIDDNTVHINNVYSIKVLKPDYKITFRMELRECKPKGAGKMDDLEKCKACQPRLLFPGN